jgi:hypothetical protein
MRPINAIVAALPMERGSVNRSNSKINGAWKISATKVAAKLLRVGDPRSVKQTSRADDSTRLV